MDLFTSYTSLLLATRNGSVSYDQLEGSLFFFGCAPDAVRTAASEAVPVGTGNVKQLHLMLDRTTAIAVALAIKFAEVGDRCAYRKPRVYGQEEDVWERLWRIVEFQIFPRMTHREWVARVGELECVPTNIRRVLEGTNITVR